jgi:hypothetical protein
MKKDGDLSPYVHDIIAHLRHLASTTLFYGDHMLINRDGRPCNLVNGETVRVSPSKAELYPDKPSIRALAHQKGLFLKSAKDVFEQEISLLAQMTME